MLRLGPLRGRTLQFVNGIKGCVVRLQGAAGTNPHVSVGANKQEGPTTRLPILLTAKLLLSIGSFLPCSVSFDIQGSFSCFALCTNLLFLDGMLFVCPTLRVSFLFGLDGLCSTFLCFTFFQTLLE